MIPVDVANRLRVVAQDSPAAPTPVVPTRKLADVLSDLVPGQRVMAEITSLLSNGTYRAIVAQRDVTLALPFSAKPGDSLELEVTESDGKLILAVVAGQKGSANTEQAGSAVATSLSQTGKLIADLLGEIDSQGRRAPPAPLNGNQPLVEAMPARGNELAPLLKQALTQSGVFYEAHQARWIAGELPLAGLLQEPQGRHSAPPDPATGAPAPAPAVLPADASASPPSPAEPHKTPADERLPPSRTSDATQAAEQLSEHRPPDLKAPPPLPAPSAGIPSDLTPLVQQQLDALATQTFAWQGQIWPGQQMQWEIEQRADDSGHRGGDDDSRAIWRTRLKLHLPQLGGISAQLSLLPGNELRIELTAETPASEACLDGAAGRLGEQMSEAGLNLTQFLVTHGEAAE